VIKIILLNIIFNKMIPDDFNWKNYLILNPDVALHQCTESFAKYHWINHGHIEKRIYKSSEVPEFDYKFYTSYYPDLSIFKTEETALKHYIQYGIKENRYPNSSGATYLLNNIFRTIYQQNIWAKIAGNLASRSGGGSDLIQTQVIRVELPKLVQKYNIKTFLDAPCGDFFWMKEVPLGCHYLGIDIVDELIENNQQIYGDKFKRLDLTNDPLPQVDLIFCRDCLVHLPYELIKKALLNFKRSGSTYLLTTTYPGINNHDMSLHTHGWRPLDLRKPPFSFPLPLELIDEKSTRTEDRLKALGLWKLSDLNVSL
jgi:hypothetical protein